MNTDKTDFPVEGTEFNFDSLLDTSREEEDTTTPESSTETEEAEQDEPSQEGDKPQEEPSEEPQEDNTSDDTNVPFHKHPRFKEVIEERDTFRKTADELRSEIESIKTSLNTAQPQNVELPKWWQVMAGDDEVSKNAYLEYLTDQKRTRETVRTELEQEIANKQSTAQQEQQDRQKKWDSWVEKEVFTLKDKGLKFNKEELVQTALEYRPLDEQGNISLQKAYEIMALKKRNPEKAEARKKIADTATGKTDTSSSETKSVDVRSLRRSSWGSLTDN